MSKESSQKIILVAIYAHPEKYPPTLNAIESLSKKFDKVVLLFRANNKEQWEYPTNVVLFPDNEIIGIQEQMQFSIFKKLSLFLNFTYKFYQLQKRYKPNVILFFDQIPILSWSIMKSFFRKNTLLWYHNHDVLESAVTGKYSIMRASIGAEKRNFKHFDLFSLPAEERKSYFPIENLKGNYHFLPNYPALSFYQKFNNKRALDKTIKLVYQGIVSHEHGLEEIISILGHPINGKALELTIYGNVSITYKNALLSLAKEHQVVEQLHFGGRITYKDLPAYTTQHHIGLAILPNSQNYNHATAGTASNKIYEYPALGLPILYYDTPHFRKHLNQYDWAFATNLSEQSLLHTLEKIDANYQDLSARATASFSKTMNFEAYVQPILNKLNLNNLELSQ